jgi:uncharacterized protein YkwD
MAVLVIAAVAGLGATACVPTVSDTPPSDPFVNSLYQALNQDRASNGLPALRWSPQLANLAGDWSAHMAQTGSLVHRDLTEVLTWPGYSAYYTLGENILTGPGDLTPVRMEAAWMGSTPHRANILSSSFNIVGIGIVWGSDGRVWATVDFGGVS